MLGSPEEADDAVEDTWQLLRRSGERGVASVEGWLTSAVTSDCINTLRWRNTRRGATQPDPVVTHPEHPAAAADPVNLALLLVLDSLAPAERVAFVLHDLFQLRYREIAPVVGGSPAAAARLAGRARRRWR
jgi:RNA polymerase sigma-70 factor (ECF subfamily)